jgi:hypothetical protein
MLMKLVSVGLKIANYREFSDEELIQPPSTEGCQGEIGFSKIQLFFLIQVLLLSKPTKINDFWIFGHIWLKKISIL